jgi:O-antigen ligase
MKKMSVLGKSTEVSPIRWILGGLAAITLYFQTNLADPFNPPKTWIAFIVAAWLIGYIVIFRNLINSSKELKILIVLGCLFVLFALVASILTDSKYIAFIGDTQRRNGFISYLALVIIFIASAVFMRLFNIKRLYIVTYVIASITAVYAFMQTNGKDFVKWNNNYNSIIGTVGNPNFAAALMAVMGIILFSIVFINEFAIYYRVFAGILVILLLGLIIRSNARQGLLAYILGAGVYLVIWIFGKNKKLGLFASFGGVIVFIFSVLGMLQIGPLERFLYKPTVSVRGFYWRAGIEMLKNHPLFGVGMDRYGAYFKEYREVGYPLSYGFDITSSNAHNTFIQLFATGGIFLGLIYILLIGYIFTRAVIGLRTFTGNNRLLLAGVFSAWIAFQAQSLISIDNIGISIWGWVLGGAIVGLSISSNSNVNDDRKYFIGRQNEINLARVTVSSATAVIAFSLVVLLYRGEINTAKARANFNLQDQTTRMIFKDLQIKASNTLLNDPQYSLSCGMYLIQNGFMDEGLNIVKKIHAEDPRNLDAVNALALTYEILNNIPEAIIYREKMAKLDQWNAVNYLSLGKDYKTNGDLAKSKEMLDKILSFAKGPNADPVVAQAKAALGS